MNLIRKHFEINRKKILKLIRKIYEINRKKI